MFYRVIIVGVLRGVFWCFCLRVVVVFMVWVIVGIFGRSFFFKSVFVAVFRG